MSTAAAMFKPEEMHPDMVLPRAVRDKIAEGRAAFDANAGIVTPPSLQEVPTPSAEPPPTNGEPAPEPVQEQHAPTPEPEQPPPQQGFVEKDTYDRLVAQHKTLQGKYSAEVPNMARKLAEMQNEISLLKSASVAPTPLPAKAKPSKLTKDEIEAYGTDMIDVVGRRAAEVFDEQFGPELETLREKLAKAEAALENVGRDVSQVATSSLETYLTEHLPGWRAQDGDPAFLQWLREEDPTFGLPRLDGLAHAKNNRRFDRVLSIFQGYLSEKGISAQPANGAPRKDTQPTVKLDTLVAPDGRRRTSPVTEPQAPQAVTGKDIKDYYAAKARGAYADRPAEIATIEARIARALAAGLVVA